MYIVNFFVCNLDKMDDLYSKSAINFFNVNASFKKQLKISIVDIGDS